MGTALVTGASTGIGREFALRLADRGHDVILVARDRERLQEVAAEVEAAGRHAEVLVADLADRSQLEEVADRLRDSGRPIDLLVNNAGFGQGRSFLGNDVAQEELALDVMVRAVLVLSHAGAGPMRERGHGGIVNVSSFAGFVAMSSYSAIKAWVTVFSEALAGELRGSGVGVTAVCPTFTHSEFHDRADLNMSRLPGHLWLDVDIVVTDALKALDRGRVVTVPGVLPKVLAGGLRVVPRSAVRATSNRLGEMRRRHG